MNLPNGTYAQTGTSVNAPDKGTDEKLWGRKGKGGSTKPYDVNLCVYGAQKPPYYYGGYFAPKESSGAHPLLFCPEGLDLKAKLLQLGCRNLLRHVWKFFHVVTLCYLHKWNKRSERDGFRPLNSKILRAQLGSHHAKQVIKILKEAGIIESDGCYVPGRHSIGYRLREPYHSGKFRRVTTEELPRFPRAAKKVCRLQIQTNGTPQHGHLLTTLRQITLHDQVYEYLRAGNFSSVGEFDYCLRSVEFVKTGELFFNFDKSTGRVFNNVTNMPKEIRTFLRLDGRPLVELDVANCQPFLLLDLYPAGCKERAGFAQTVSDGRFYEALDEMLPEPYGEAGRPQLKRAVFSQVLFDRLRPTVTHLKSAFDRRFPVLAAILDRMKARDHTEIARRLQQIEAELVIGTVVRQVAEGLGLPLLTVHDSILALDEDSALVGELIIAAFEKRFNCIPRLRVTKYADRFQQAR